jgi:hypothetical protein
VAMDQMLRKAVFAALIGAITVLTIYEASAAVRFKRFAHCPEGLVSKKTCECHAGSSGRFHFCHAGQNCDTIRSVPQADTKPLHKRTFGVARELQNAIPGRVSSPPLLKTRAYLQNAMSIDRLI